MPTIEDELRRILDVQSDNAPVAPGRRDSVHRRINHRRSVRTAVLAAVAVIAVLVTGGVVIGSTRLHVLTPAVLPTEASVAPTPRPSTPVAPDVWTPSQPGTLPEYRVGQKLVKSVSIDLSKTRTVTLTFTPTAWNFNPAYACATPTSGLFLALEFNGFDAGGSGCVNGLGMNDSGYMADTAFYKDQQDGFYADQVQPGQPFTITGTVGFGDNEIDRQVTTPIEGLVTIGIYESVPFAQYPLPPKPKDGIKRVTGPKSDQLTHLLGRIGSGAAGTHAIKTLTIRLDHHIELGVETSAPCMLSIYIDNFPLAQYNTWNWFDGVYSDGAELVGPGDGRLFDFHAGQTVTLRVVASSVAAPDDWAVAIYGG